MKWILCIFFVTLSQLANSQQSFFIRFDSTKMFYARDITFDEDHHTYVCAMAWEHNDPYYNNYILKLDPNGNLLASWWQKDFSPYYLENSRIHLLNDTLYLFGYGDPHDAELHAAKVFLKKFDSDLNLITEYEYPLDSTKYRSIHHTCRIKYANNEFMFFSSAYRKDPLIRLSPFYLRINRDGQFIKAVHDNQNQYMHICYDLIKKPNSEGFYTMMLEYSPTAITLGYLYDYDILLDTISTKKMPNFFNNYFTALPILEDAFYISGSYIDPAPFSIRQVGVMKMSVDGTALDSYLFAPLTDSMSYTAYYNSLDTLSDGNLIMCSSYGIDYQFQPQNDPSFICLYKLSPDLDLIWQRYIGGENNYEAYSMKVAPDDGIVIAGGFCKIPIANPYEKDLIIFKTDANGLITSIGDENPQIRSSEAIIFPNPARDMVTIDFSRVYQEATFQLIDISGKTVLETQLTANRQHVDISGVPTGTYVYRIFNGEALDERGKLVTE